MSANPPSHRRRTTVSDRTRARILAAAYAIREADTTQSRAAKWAARDLRDQVIRDEYLAGVNTHQIVALFEEGGAPISRQQVVRIHRTVERPTLFDLADATERYRRGDSLRDLARDYRMGSDAVKKALQAAGVEIRSREEAKRVGRRWPRKEVAT